STAPSSYHPPARRNSRPPGRSPHHRETRMFRPSTSSPTPASPPRSLAANCPIAAPPRRPRPRLKLPARQILRAQNPAPSFAIPPLPPPTDAPPPHRQKCRTRIRPETHLVANPNQPQRFAIFLE